MSVDEQQLISALACSFHRLYNDSVATAPTEPIAVSDELCMVIHILFDEVSNEL
jgi:hypothetical protein